MIWGCVFSGSGQLVEKIASRGAARATIRRPDTFPHRIWAACDFEGRTADYGWFAPPQTNPIPNYPGNRTALGAVRPYQSTSAVMTGVNPVPGPRMGKENWLYLRYFLKGGSEATFQHFSLTREDNWHIKVSGLENSLRELQPRLETQRWNP